MKEDTKKKREPFFDFQSEGIDLLLRGQSIIDSIRGLDDYQFRDSSDIAKFLLNYGYDLEDPIERAEVFGNLHEAMGFIRKYFLQPENPDGLKLEIPRKILEINDVFDLIQYACSAHASQQRESSPSDLQAWACAILKVVHTIAHMDKDIRTSAFADIQKQILDRFYKGIHRDAQETLYLGENDDDPLRVDLVSFETKPKKPRDSTLLKLLHKSENVAEDIFDRVGVRFITRTKLDALRVVNHLVSRGFVIPANIKPSRSRNTLIPLDELRAFLSQNRSKLTDAKVEAWMNEFHGQSKGSGNKHTSEFYRSIQFTGRRLVKLRNPVFDDIKELKAQSKAHGLGEETARVLERIDLKYIPKESRFFYPFEVQIVDRQSYQENEQGRSAHSEYRKAQIQTAIKRVMRGLYPQ